MARNIQENPKKNVWATAQPAQCGLDVVELRPVLSFEWSRDLQQETSSPSFFPENEFYF